LKVVIPGGTGQLGTVLARALHADGHEIVILGRSPTPGPERVIAWDGCTVGDWAHELEGADVVVNLAGRSVNCRYNSSNRQAMMDSRVDSTRAVGLAIEKARRPPRVWLQMSTATIYAHRFDAPNDEATGLIGGDEPDAPASWAFSIEIARAWEDVLTRAHTPHTRKLALRASVVMNPDAGSIFDTLLGLTRRGLGGPIAGGRQYVSWIHEDDLVRAVRYLIEHEDLDGAINVCAPEPLPQREFQAALRAAWGIRLGLPATAWMVHLGALFLRTEPELVLKSRRVVPGRLLQHGFRFDWPTWPAAARDLVARWRARRERQGVAAGRA
jgi:uncharacterized protein (TIGR01777 family)